jgi:hypothetical protein
MNTKSTFATSTLLPVLCRQRNLPLLLPLHFLLALQLFMLLQTLSALLFPRQTITLAVNKRGTHSKTFPFHK